MDRQVLKKIIADQREYQIPRNFFDRSQSITIRKFIDDPNVLILLSGIR